MLKLILILNIDVADDSLKPSRAVKTTTMSPPLGAGGGAASVMIHEGWLRSDHTFLSTIL